MNRVHIQHLIPTTHVLGVPFARLITQAVAALGLDEPGAAHALPTIQETHELCARDTFAEVEADLWSHRNAVFLRDTIVVGNVWYRMLHRTVVHEAPHTQVPRGQSLPDNVVGRRERGSGHGLEDPVGMLSEERLCRFMTRP